MAWQPEDLDQVVWDLCADAEGHLVEATDVAIALGVDETELSAVLVALDERVQAGGVTLGEIRRVDVHGEFAERPGFSRPAYGPGRLG